MAFRDDITDAELNAFADGHLSRRRAKRIAAGLRNDPEAAERLQAYLRQDRALADAYRPVLSEPVPERLRRVVSRPPARVGWQAATGMAAALVLAAFVTWQLLPGPELPEQPPQDLTTVALDTFAQPGEAADAAPPPELHPAGFNLYGKRRFQQDGREIREYLFRNDAGQRVGLYLSADDGAGSAAYRVVTRGDTKAVEWREQDLQYVLVGMRAVSDLTRLAVELRSETVHAGAAPAAPAPTPRPATVADAPATADVGVGPNPVLID